MCGVYKVARCSARSPLAIHPVARSAAFRPQVLPHRCTLYLIMSESVPDSKLMLAELDEMSDDADRIISADVTQENHIGTSLLLWSVKDLGSDQVKRTISVLFTREMIPDMLPGSRGSLLVDPEQRYEPLEELTRSIRHIPLDHSHQSELKQWYESLSKGSSSHIDLATEVAVKREIDEQERAKHWENHPLSRPDESRCPVLGTITYWIGGGPLSASKDG